MDAYEEIQRTAYEEFIERLIELEDPKRSKQSRWKTKTIFENNEQICCACLTPNTGNTRSPLGTSWLIPVSIGGPDIHANRVLLCRSCSTMRGNCDITDPSFTSRLCAPLPAETLKKRFEILLHGENHLTSTWPMAPREKVQALLEKRYEHPRFRVFAHASPVGCFVGYRKHVNEPQAYAGASALLRHVHRATVEQRSDLVVFQLKSRVFLDAVWAMIETNGLVVPIHLNNSMCSWNSVDQYDWRKVWTEIYDRFDDVRRRYRTGQAVQPWAPKVYSTNKNTVRSRNRNKRELKERNLRAIELRHAAMLEENHMRWINPSDPGYKFRPVDEIVWRTFQEAHYWRLTPNERRIYLLDNPSFRAPSLEPDASLDP
jgi:hypothetical protein